MPNEPTLNVPYLSVHNCLQLSMNVWSGTFYGQNKVSCENSIVAIATQVKLYPVATENMHTLCECTERDLTEEGFRRK